MFTLPALPFAQDALAPHMSAATLSLHHGKHHEAYVAKLNDLIAGTAFEQESLEQIILATKSADRPGDREIFNNAAQHWNHAFFWKCLAPDGGGKASPGLATAIDRAFGGLDGFKETFQKEAVGHFGSGWVWLVQLDGGLEIVSTHDANTPLSEGKTPILCCDLWEHAYYLDHQNRRAEFIETFLENLVNWPFAETQYAGEATLQARQERFEESGVHQQ